MPAPVPTTTTVRVPTGRGERGIRRGPAGLPRRDRAVLAAVAVVTAVSLAGAALAVTTGLSETWPDAVGSAARLSVPLPMNLAMVLLALLASSTRRWPATVGAVVLSVACTLAVVSGLFDGGYAATLGAAERGLQVALVVALCALGWCAARRVRTLRRA